MSHEIPGAGLMVKHVVLFMLHHDAHVTPLIMYTCVSTANSLPSNTVNLHV